MEQNGSKNNHQIKSGTHLFKNILYLATLNGNEEIADGAIYVKDNVIQWVGLTSNLPPQYQQADQVTDCGNLVVIPGLVNTHHHMVQCLTRCVAQDKTLFWWLKTLYKCWIHLTNHDAYISAKTAMAELILTGCTCTSDHLYIYPNDVTLDATIKAAQELGMRFHPTRGAMSIGESKGGLPPDSAVEGDEELILKDMKRLVETYHDPNKYSMLRMSLAPCAPFTVTVDLMKSAAQLARQYTNVRLHTHLAENQEDIDYSLKEYGCRPGKYIEMVGWDKDDCWFAHCCMLDDEETKQFADKGLGIAHCPSSNLRLGSGIAPIRKLLDAGVNVGIGVDGSASNDSGHFLTEARLAMLLQRAGGNPAGLTARETLRLAVEGGAKNLGRQDDIGKITPGYAADFVGWRVDGLGMAGSMCPLAALFFCTPSLGTVDLSVINGAVIVKDGKFVNFNLDEHIKEHNKCSERLMQYLDLKNDLCNQ